MGYVAIKITPEIINELIAAGYLAIDQAFYAEPAHIGTPTLDIPLDAKVSQMHFDSKIAPLGEMTVVLEHDALWKVEPGGEFPFVAIKVNK